MGQKQTVQEDDAPLLRGSAEPCPDRCSAHDFHCPACARGYEIGNEGADLSTELMSDGDLAYATCKCGAVLCIEIEITYRAEIQPPARSISAAGAS